MNQPKPTSAVSSRSGMYRTGLFLALPVLAGVASAQEAAPAPAPAAGEEIVKLSPFVIESSQENGYLASNSISGTRSNTPIKDVPMNIQVFTKALGEDILAQSQIDFERYNASLINGGADVHSSNTIAQAYQQFIFRGFRQNWSLRDGVRAYDPIDMIGVERLELVKGPSAALYGLTYAGGVMNLISKQADLYRNFTSIRLGVESEGEYRGTVDANYASKGDLGRFGVRFNGAYTRSKDHREHSEGKVEYTQILLGWEPVKGTELRLQVEDGFRQKPNNLGYYFSKELDANGNPLQTSTGQENGASIPLQVTHPNIPYTWNWDTGNMRTSEVNLVKGSFIQSFGQDLHFTGYWQASKRRNVDSNGWDSNGFFTPANIWAGITNSTTPASWDTLPPWRDGGAPTGWMYPNTANERIRLTYHYRDWQNWNHAYGATGLYKFDVANIKNTLTFGANVWTEDFQSFQGDQPENSTLMVDLPVRAGVRFNVPYGMPSDFAWNMGAGNKENNSNDAMFVNWQLSAINNRLKVNLGVNRTNLKLINLNPATLAVNSITEQSKTSPMFGAMFDITKNLSVFALHSTSLFPTSDKNDFDQTLPPETGKGNELGLKFEAMDGRLSGTVSYYQIKKRGGAQRDPLALNRAKQAFDRNPVAGVDRNSLTDRMGQPGDLVPGEENESKGYEIDMAYSPTKQYQIIFSYAHNTVEISDSVNSANIGQIPYEGPIKNQASLLNKYSFESEALKGLSIGGGLAYQGKSYQGKHNGIARYTPSSLYAEIFGTYAFKAFGAHQSIQLNIKNLTEQEEYAGWKATGSAARTATERYEIPTKRIIYLTYGIDF